MNQVHEKSQTGTSVPGSGSSRGGLQNAIIAPEALERSRRPGESVASFVIRLYGLVFPGPVDLRAARLVHFHPAGGFDLPFGEGSRSDE